MSLSLGQKDANTQTKAVQEISKALKNITASEQKMTQTTFIIENIIFILATVTDAGLVIETVHVSVNVYFVFVSFCLPALITLLLLL